ncbi:MAG: putative Ig domain-containing protein, partial [Saprospiraceae bacterium]
GLFVFNTTFNCLEMNIGTPTQPVWNCLSVANAVTAASASPSLCVNTPLTPITHLTTGATGIGSATGLPPGLSPAWASNTITISGTPTAGGTYNYTIPLEGGAGNAEAMGTISVLEATTVGAASASPTLSVNTALTPITHATTGATGIGSATNLPPGVSAVWTSNTITISGTPTVPGTYSYSIPVTGGCGSANATGTITVTAAGTADCGAYLAPGVWKAFMCHNLGADQSADPFTPSWQLNGHYYQWGRAAVAAAGPTGPSSGEANDGAIAGWNTTGAPDGAWSDDTKTANDPCPAGFRVPTKAQWDAVVNTSLNPTRSFVATSWTLSSTNYSSGLRIGSGSSGLFLPMTGIRDFTDGLLYGRGGFGDYWSSGKVEGEDGPGLFSLIIGENLAITGYRAPTFGSSVRCVAE